MNSGNSEQTESCHTSRVNKGLNHTGRKYGTSKSARKTNFDKKFRKTFKEVHTTLQTIVTGDKKMRFFEFRMKTTFTNHS